MVRACSRIAAITKGFIRVLFFDMYPLAFFDFFGVFLSGESYAANEKSRKVDFFRCKPDLSTRTGLGSKSKQFFSDNLT